MTGEPATLTLHATAVARDGRGVLILGASGSGKSGLALGLIARGAQLVADDRVVLERTGGGKLVASAPPAIAGMIEARGLGLLRLPAVARAEVVLAVDLDAPPETRMPHLRDFTCLGCTLRLISGRGLPNLEPILTLFLQGKVDLPD